LQSAIAKGLRILQENNNITNTEQQNKTIFGISKVIVKKLQSEGYARTYFQYYSSIKIDAIDGKVSNLIRSYAGSAVKLFYINIERSVYKPRMRSVFINNKLTYIVVDGGGEMRGNYICICCAYSNEEKIEKLQSICNRTASVANLFLGMNFASELHYEGEIDFSNEKISLYPEAR
jgi:hypothetical protein